MENLVPRSTSRSMLLDLFVGFLPTLLNQRNLLLQLTKREISQRYRGTFLGIFWALLTPLMQLALYTLVFGVILKARWTSGQAEGGLSAFALTLFCGLSVFSMFSESVNASPTLILTHANYVKKVVFPLELLSVTKIITAMFHGLSSLATCVLLQWYMSGEFPFLIVYTPVLLIPLFIWILGICWLLSAVGVYLRDLQQLMPPVMTALFFLSPIIYNVDVVPEWLLPIYRLNPLCYFVENFRRIVLWHQHPDFRGFLLWMAAGILFSHVAYALFQRLRKGFSDVV
jgi:lipopolysaccharide transport system permease protein